MPPDAADFAAGERVLRAQAVGFGICALAVGAILAYRFGLSTTPHHVGRGVVVGLAAFVVMWAISVVLYAKSKAAVHATRDRALAGEQAHDGGKA